MTDITRKLSDCSIKIPLTLFVFKEIFFTVNKIQSIRHMTHLVALLFLPNRVTLYVSVSKWLPLIVRYLTQ